MTVCLWELIERKQTMIQVFEPARTNEEMIQGIQNGDPDCAAAFHHRYGARIHRLVWSILGADRDHEDVVQIVFVAILDSLDSIEDPLRLDHWVDSVVFRTVRKELRSRSYRRRVIPSTDSMEAVIDLRSPDAPLVARRFYRAMDLLKPEERMIFILKYFENHTLTEMAQISGWSVATVKRRIDEAEDSFRTIAGADTILTAYTGDASHVGS
jgi:RNA polymerase sigma-70 factor (ECF subfamily)